MSSLVVGFRWKPPVLPALPGPRTASRLNASTVQPQHPAQGPGSLRAGQPRSVLPGHLVGVGWEARWPGASPTGALVRKHFSASVYMRTALLSLSHISGTAIRARPHFPATSGLGSDICLSLVFKSHPSLWYSAKGSTPASIWHGVGAHCTGWGMLRAALPLRS